jgi:hypothetical protein
MTIHGRDSLKPLLVISYVRVAAGRCAVIGRNRAEDSKAAGDEASIVDADI